MTGAENYIISEEQRACKIDDSELKCNPDERISIRFKIPEDFSYQGKIFGSVMHVEGSVSSKMRSNTLDIELLGPKPIFKAPNIQANTLLLRNA